MALTLYSADAGVSKSRFAINAVLQCKEQDRLAKIWVLLATERQIHAFRSLLVNTASERALFNIEFFNFYDLYTRILDSAGIPQRALDESARLALLRMVIIENAGVPFQAVAHKPGFTSVISAFIYELKQNLIEPEQFQFVGASAKIRQLGSIYAAYQDRLKRSRLVDREGGGWLALAALQKHQSLTAGVRLLVVDGYDQFTILQAEILAHLSRQCQETAVTLSRAQGREDLIGKRAQQARSRLAQAQERLGDTLYEQDIPYGSDTRDTRIQHLTFHFMRGDAAKFKELSHNSGSTIEKRSTDYANWLDQGVHFIEAPDIASEVSAVLRRVKLLLLNGKRPDDVIIAVRDWDQYAPWFRSQSQRYHLPVTLDSGSPLLDNPAIAALLHILELHRGDFRRRDVLDVLRSPYFPKGTFSPQDVDILEQISAVYRVIGGRHAWLNALDKMIHALENSAASLFSEDSEQMDSNIRQYPPAQLVQLRLSLEQFFDGVTPPLTGTTGEHVTWLESLIGGDASDIEDATGTAKDDLAAPDSVNENDANDSVEPQFTLDMLAQIRQTAPGHTTTRDLEAIRSLKQTLRGMLTASALVNMSGYARTLSAEAFYGELRSAISAAYMNANAGRDGRVLITTASEARGLPHDVVCIVGLSEGVFPSPTPEDPLLLDSEREQLRQYGIHLPSEAERADDLGVFFELTAQAHQYLLLSRPTVKKGAPWVESPLWRSASALFAYPPIQTIKLGTAISLQESCTVSEAAIALASSDNSKHKGWFGSAYPQLAAQITRSWSAEMARINRQRSPYNGQLTMPMLTEWVKTHLGDHHVWSASQLNDLGVCAFKFFAGRLLKIEKLKELEEGLDALTLGSIYHKILEDTYRALQEHGIAIGQDQVKHAQPLLDEALEQNLADAAQVFDFLPSTLWEKEQAVIGARLNALLSADFTGKFKLPDQLAEGRYTVGQEWEFGVHRPLMLDLGGGDIMRVRGKIDRVDLSSDGSTALIMDYKSSQGSIPNLQEYERGRNFQMMIYLLAAKQLLKQKYIAGAFIDISKAKSSTIYWLENAPENVAAHPQILDPHIGLERLRKNIKTAQAGDFTAEANGSSKGRCDTYCDFVHLCRMRIMARTSASNGGA